MSNQLILKEEVTLFDRIRGFFKGIFSKKKNKKEVIEVRKENTNIKQNIKNEVEDEKTKIIKEIENHPERIEHLSDDILDKLIRYYKKITSAKKQKINELRSR